MNNGAIKAWRILRWVLPVPCLALPIMLRSAGTSAAVSQQSSGGELWTLMSLEIPLLLFSLFVLVVSLVRVFFKRTRKTAVLGCLCAVAFLIGFTMSGGSSWKIEREAYVEVAKRSRPLIDAIKAYEKEFGRPPGSLDQLVPRFISKMPDTGIGAVQHFEYLTGENARRYDGNPWVLRIDPPQAGIGWDQFFYFPLQNYPERGYGGSLERIGDWAYVHE